MKNTVLSVIVPVYNVQDYLRQCVDSIINQSYKNLEIILVDDGSTDDSGIICDDYAKKYDNVLVFHKPNGGQSSARNLGLKKAKSDYIAFIDSDDFIEPNMFEVLLNHIFNYNADISMCSYRPFFNDCVREREEDSKISVFYEDDVLLRLYYEFSPCNKIFKKTLFDNINFPEGKIYEDARTIYKLAASAKCAVVEKKCFYNYRIRNTGTMGSFSIENFLDRVSVWDEIYDFVHSRFSRKDLAMLVAKKNRLVIELLTLILKRKQLIDQGEIIVGLVSHIKRPFIMNSKISLKSKIIGCFFIMYSFLLLKKNRDN